MKFYVTKYALTNGIEEVDVKVDPATTKSPKFLGINGFCSAWGEGQQWHRTMEESCARSDEMRLKKIQSLKQSIKRLEQLRFDQDQKNSIA